MPVERTNQGWDAGLLDTAMLVLCRPLDRVRRRCLQALMPLIDALLGHRENRVALTGCVIILASLVMSLMLPLWQLALGPILFGTLHILADFRYCVVRPGFHRRWPVVLCCGAPLVAMMCGQGLDIGLLAVAFAFALANGPLWKRITGLGMVSAAGMLVAEYGFFADVFFAHFHNVVAVLLWWVWRVRLGKVHWAVLGMYLGVWLGLLGGAFDGLYFALASSGWGPEGQSMAYYAGFLGFGQTGMEAVRWVLAFAMAQSVHYWFWLRMVPEDDRKQYTPRSFTASWKALRQDMGTVFLWLTLLAALGTAAWAVVDLLAAREGYLRIVRFHGILELAAAALLWVEGRERLLDITATAR